ncbi:M23 family metallopeptidase [Paeniglutamicibacter antarcticus]|uniref:M23ase beta-sheet core domain-containing protein n=1 Tax=Paeniglutamicibacter antarcticus TaxID=494023 RepID=A0ABP9TJA8_9MICC
MNRGWPPNATGKKSPSIPALGLVLAATMALSGASGLGGAVDQLAPQAIAAPMQASEDYVAPVTVSLLSGVDAINWQAPDITSIAADGQWETGRSALFNSGNPGSAPRAAGRNAVGVLVGQNMGRLGTLPGNLRLIHPVTSRHITSPYGWRNNPTGPGTQIHIGQDYAIPCGSPVYASADGTVIQSAWAGHSGMRVTLDNGSSVRTGYSHNSKLIAKVGEKVKQGQLLALSGTTGNSTGCHVHFEVIINGRWNDPRNFLPPISGQPNPMIDSRRTTIAAEPIRNAGAPVAEARGRQERPDAAPKTHVASPEPASTRTPSATPTKTRSHVKPRPMIDPAPSTNPAPSSKPTPSSKPAPQHTASPKPTHPSPPSKTPPAPDSSPEPTASAPTPAPRTPAPSTSPPEGNKPPRITEPTPEPEEPSAVPTGQAELPPSAEPTEPKAGDPTPEEDKCEPLKPDLKKEAKPEKEAQDPNDAPEKIAEPQCETDLAQCNPAEGAVTRESAPAALSVLLCQPASDPAHK